MSKPQLIAASIALRPYILAWDLGKGESSVIALAETIPNALVVLDDLAARRCAESLRVPLVGTLGLVFMAKQKGLISLVGPAIDAILAAGLYISPRHIEAIKSKAGEST